MDSDSGDYSNVFIPINIIIMFNKFTNNMKLFFILLSISQNL